MALHSFTRTQANDMEIVSDLKHGPIGKGAAIEISLNLKQCCVKAFSVSDRK